MTSKKPVTFQDKVRVIVTPETEARGVAGLVGVVYGETTPSVTSVEVIGELASDYAVNVVFDGNSETFWFVPELLEFADESGLVAAPTKMKKWF
jgi:hypothetical protein